MADAGDVYVSWRWADDALARGVAVLPRDQVRETLRLLTDAVPDPARPEDLRRVMTVGALADPEAESVLAQSLSRTLLPYGLAVQLYELSQRGIRPHLRIQPSPRLAQVPWEIIAPDPELRLLDIADVSLLAPVSVVHAPGRITRRWNDTRELPVVAVLDPRVPGFRADSELGSVLGRPSAQTLVAQHFGRYAERVVPRVDDAVELFRRADIDRDWLSEVLRAGASRLVYVGHVTSPAPESGHSEHAELHLGCTAGTRGFAATNRTHRPLSAKDLLLGTHTLDPSPVSGRDRWPMPSRVALIACESGGDLRFTEALGLTTAALSAGAELVTATRWPLPTDHAFHTLTPTTGHPLQAAICAVDTAHDSSTPVHTLLTWQRAQLAAWRDAPTAENSPLLWAAFATVTD
ncbi:CHAT domain-containing protein [Nocardia alba]|uniref:CHAT domain-containing protein n=1 Tax=Nocardia alba TaxID=225051 RepID=A0A4R1G991_9NOCA|nr:CHAT domain-containing protein [Nocardia alba]TCK00652.1 CHAT domain-containing protein [Nocardia alba]